MHLNYSLRRFIRRNWSRCKSYSQTLPASEAQDVWTAVKTNTIIMSLWSPKCALRFTNFHPHLWICTIAQTHNYSSYTVYKCPFFTLSGQGRQRGLAPHGLGLNPGVPTPNTHATESWWRCSVENEALAASWRPPVKIHHTASAQAFAPFL